MTSDLERTRFDGDPLTVFGLIDAAAVAGAWFGPISWPVLRRTYAVIRD